MRVFSLLCLVGCNDPVYEEDQNPYSHREVNAIIDNLYEKQMAAENLTLARGQLTDCWVEVNKLKAELNPVVEATPKSYQDCVWDCNPGDLVCGYYAR